jgi:hypothetical protein
MENLLNQNPANTNGKPDNVPDKFFDKEKGEIRTDALLKSYQELEKKLAQQTPNDPAKIDPDKLRNFLGVPSTPQDYQVKIDHTMFTADDEINQRLHDKGFSNEQVQTVYDLAAEKMVPLILDIAREFEAERQLDKLFETFGGKERYSEVARQLLAYGQKNLPADVLEGLSGTYEGIMALYKMMQSGKPLSVQQPVETPSMDETSLRGMMKDPKYWREKDPAFIKKVSDGFRQVFADPNNG